MTTDGFKYNAEMFVTVRDMPCVMRAYIKWDPGCCDEHDGNWDIFESECRNTITGEIVTMEYRALEALKAYMLAEWDTVTDE